MSDLLKLLSVAAVCLVAGGWSLAEENWPEFRGPHADGQVRSGRPPIRWSETENVVWKTALPGRAWSSPVVWGDQVWLTNATEDGRELFAVCLQRETGEILLNRKQFDLAQPPEIHKFNSYASPSPAIEEGRVYLSWGSYGLACLDTRTFETLWVRRDLECDHYRGPGSSPIIWGNLLIEHYDGYDYQYIIALDKYTGDTVWRTPRPHNFGTDNGDIKKAYATPLVVEIDGRLQLISPTSKGMFAYDPATGEEIWRIRYEGFSTPCRPLYDPTTGLILISTGFSKGMILAMNPRGTGDLTDTNIPWIESRSMPSKPSPLLHGEHLFTIHDQGIASCLQVATGELLWQQRIGGNFSASPIMANGLIYVFDEAGKTTVFAPETEYREVAVNQLADGCMGSPAVAGNALFLRTREAVYRLEQRK